MLFSSRHYDDRRKFHRMEMGCPVIFEEINSKRQIHGTCINLSAQGMLIETETEFAIGSRFRVFVEPQVRISPPFAAMMEVVRVEQSLARGSFRIGGRIESIPIDF